MTACPPSRLPELDPAILGPERQQVLQEVAGDRGRVPTPYRVWIASPGLARALHQLGAFLACQTSLSKQEKEIAILAAASHWRAGYVLAVHAREAREAGLPEAVVSDLAAGRPARPDGPRQRALAAMMTALCGEEPPPDEVFRAAVAAVGHEGVAEAIAAAGYFTAVGLAMKMYAVPLPTVMPGGRDS